jgi:hypothetical protein
VAVAVAWQPIFISFILINSNCYCYRDDFYSHSHSRSLYLYLYLYFWSFYYVLIFFLFFLLLLVFIMVCLAFPLCIQFSLPAARIGLQCCRSLSPMCSLTFEFLYATFDRIYVHFIYIHFTSHALIDWQSKQRKHAPCHTNHCELCGKLNEY